MQKRFKLSFSFLAVFIALFLVSEHMGSAQARYAIRHISEFSQDITKTALFTIAFDVSLRNGQARDVPFVDTPAMHDFYATRNNKPVWVNEDIAVSEIEDALHVFDYAWTHGLDPDLYHTSKIRQLLHYPTPAGMAYVELLLTDAFIRYGRDLSGMRIDPTQMKSEARFWKKPDLAKDVLASLVKGHDPLTVLKSLGGPKHQMYSKLRTELVRLSGEKAMYDHILPINLERTYFKPGDKHHDVRKLRVRLGLEGALSSETSPQKYDGDVVKAVEDFQMYHGLEPDGIIGPITLALLNQTRQDKIDQLTANLERLRWMPERFPDRYIMVNIPSQTLEMYDGGKKVDEMKVIVGKSWRQTKSFSAEISGVRFNPTWTVPLRLKMRDILPHIQEDSKRPVKVALRAVI